MQVKQPNPPGHSAGIVNFRHYCRVCIDRVCASLHRDVAQLIPPPIHPPPSRSYYSDRGTCAKCYLSCHTCSGPRRDQCVKCPKDWQLADGECHPECPEGFFKSAFGCQKCHHICKTCSGKCYADGAAARSH